MKVIHQRKLYLLYETISFFMFLGLYKLHTLPAEQENESLRQLIAKSIYIISFALLIGLVLGSWRMN